MNVDSKKRHAMDLLVSPMKKVARSNSTGSGKTVDGSNVLPSADNGAPAMGLAGRLCSKIANVVGCKNKHDTEDGAQLSESDETLSDESCFEEIEYIRNSAQEGPLHVAPTKPDPNNAKIGIPAETSGPESSTEASAIVVKKCTHEKDEFEVPFRVIHSNICVENCTIKLLNRKEMEFLTIKSLLEVFAKNNPKEPDLSALKLRFGGLKMRENGEYRILPFFGNKSFSEVMKIGSESDAKISTITITMDYDQEVTQNMRADIIAILREDVYESDSEMPILKKKDGECDELLAEGLSDSKDGYTKDGKGTCDELSGVVLTRSKVVDTTPDLHQRRRPFLDVEGSFAEDDLAFILDNDTGSK